jgi:ATP-dependent RNA helicase RhlE
VLVATDVASRGLDIDNVDVVIQLGCRHIDSFVHRSGRTGRVGKDGENIIMIYSDEIDFLMGLEKELNINIDISSSMHEVDIEKQSEKLSLTF